MQYFALRSMDAVLTFAVGVALVWLVNHRELIQNQSALSSPASKSTEDSAAALTLSEPCSPPTAKLRKIDALMAVRVAECFIIQNGYTNLPPMRDKSKLAYEGIDSSDPDERLRARYDTLQPKAYGVLSQSRSGEGWTVAFQYNLNNAEYQRAIPNFRESIRGNGRAVTMDAYGGSLRVQHQDCVLRAFKRVEEISH